MATEILRPNATGDLTNIPTQYPATGSHYDKVDDVTPDDDASYVSKATDGFAYDLYNLPAHSVGSGTINHIRVYARLKTSASEAYQRVSVKSGSTQDNKAPGKSSTAWTTLSYQWNTNPATGLAWTWDDIDDLQIGVGLIGATGSLTSYCTQLYVEVDYTPGATEKESAESGAGADSVEALVTQQDKEAADSGGGVDAVESLTTPQAKSANDGGGGVEATVAANATLESAESGGALEAAEVNEAGQLKDSASQEGEGVDRLVAKIETPVKGGGMKLWT